MSQNKNYKYLTLFSLYIAQSVPMTFFSTVLPVIMRQNHFSLTAIGLLQLVKLPWILKFLWAPYVDKYAKNTAGYKRIIFTSEAIYAVFIFIIAFLNLQVNFSLIVVLLILAFTASATQDIATDAFAILILKKEERSIGNSMQSGGAFAGTLIGSGVLLTVYAKFGWKYLVIGLVAFVLIALIPLVFEKSEVNVSQTTKNKVSLADIIYFFAQKGIWKHVILLFFFYAPLIGILTMSKPWLVDLGYKISQIGLYFGIIGPTAGFLTSLLAGYIIRSIGRKRSLVAFISFDLLVTIYFVFLGKITVNTNLLVVGLILLWMAYGASSVLVYTLAMDNVRGGREGTDFTIQVVTMHLGSLVMAVLSGKIAHNIHYSGLFVLETAIALCLLAYVLFYTNQKISQQ